MDTLPDTKSEVGLVKKDRSEMLGEIINFWEWRDLGITVLFG